MALFPEIATVMLLPQGKFEQHIEHDCIVLHTNGGPGSGPGLWNYWANPPSDIFSHFQVDADGTAYQYQDTDLEAPAEYAGNLRGISIETQDKGNPDTPWTLAQATKIAEIVRAVGMTHIIPLTMMTDESSRGIGYHSMWPDWNKSKHNCPGPVRVQQIDFVLREANLVDEDDMALTYITHDGGKEPRLLDPSGHVGGVLGPTGAKAMHANVAGGIGKIADMSLEQYNANLANGTL